MTRKTYDIAELEDLGTRFDHLFRDIKQLTDELEEWLNTLSDIDKSNFNAITSIPIMVAGLPDGQYKFWASFVIIFTKRINNHEGR